MAPKELTVSYCIISPISQTKSGTFITKLIDRYHNVAFNLVNWCFEPSQPLGIISELKETFIKRYIVERTKKSEIRPEEQSEKTESCWENLWNGIQLKGS